MMFVMLSVKYPVCQDHVVESKMGFQVFCFKSELVTGFAQCLLLYDEHQYIMS